MKRARFPREAVNGVWDYVRKYGLSVIIPVCLWIWMILRVPGIWFLTTGFPVIPKIVITSSLLNKMKSDLTEEEFWYFIRQLANFRRHGSVVRKKETGLLVPAVLMRLKLERLGLDVITLWCYTSIS